MFKPPQDGSPWNEAMLSRGIGASQGGAELPGSLGEAEKGLGIPMDSPPPPIANRCKFFLPMQPSTP